MSSAVARNTFYKKQDIDDIINVNPSFKDIPLAAGNTFSLTNATNKNFALLSGTVPDNPSYGSSQLVGGFLSLFCSDVNMKQTSKVPNLMGYLVNPQYSIDEGGVTLAPKGNKVTVINSIPFNETPIISEDFDGDTSLGIIPRMAGNAIQNLSQGFIMKTDLKEMFKDLGIYSNDHDFDHFYDDLEKTRLDDGGTQFFRGNISAAIVEFSQDRRTFNLISRSLSDRGLLGYPRPTVPVLGELGIAIADTLGDIFPKVGGGSRGYVVGTLHPYFDHQFDTLYATNKRYLKYASSGIAGPELDSNTNANENNTIFSDIFCTIDNTNAFESGVDNPLITSAVELSTEKSLNGGQSLRLYHNWGYSTANTVLQNSFGASGNLNPQVIRASVYDIPAPAYQWDASMNTLSATEPLPGISGNMSVVVPEISMGINISKLSPMVTLNLGTDSDDFSKVYNYYASGSSGIAGGITATDCSSFENTFLRSVVITFSNYKPLPEHTTVDKFLNYGMENFYTGKEYDNIVGGIVFCRYGIDGGEVGAKNDGDNIYAYTLPVAPIKQRQGGTANEKVNFTTGMGRVSGNSTGDIPNLDKMVWGFQQVNDTNMAADTQMRYVKLPTNGWFNMRCFIDPQQTNGTGSFVKRIYAPSSSTNPSYPQAGGSIMRAIFETNEGMNQHSGVASQSGSINDNTIRNLQFLDIGFPTGKPTGGGQYPSGGNNWDLTSLDSQRFYPKHMTIWVNNYRWVQGQNSNTPTNGNMFGQGDNAVTAQGANTEAEVFIDNIRFLNFGPKIENCTSGVGKNNLIFKPNQFFSPRSAMISGAIGNGTTTFPAKQINSWVRAAPISKTALVNVTSGDSTGTLLSDRGAITTADLENMGNVTAVDATGTKYANEIAVAGTGIPAGAYLAIVDATTIKFIDSSGGSEVLATSSGEKELTFTSSGSLEPYYNIATMYEYNAGQNVLFGFNEKADLPITPAADGVAQGYLMFNNFYSSTYDELKDSPIANAAGANAFKNKYLATNAGGLLSMTDTHETIDELGATMYATRRITGGSNNLSGSAFLVTGGESDNAISLRTGTSNFVNNDGFRQKGFIRLDISGASGTPNPANWGKREHVCASVKVMDFAGMTEQKNNPIETLQRNQIRVSDTSIFNYEDPDETYVLYRMGGIISSTAVGNRYRLTGLKLDRDTPIKNNIVTFTTNLQNANDSDYVLLNSETAPWVWVSPEKYWVTMLVDTPPDLTPRNYESVGTITEVPTTSNVTGTTFNESDYFYDASSVGTGGAAGLYFNSWNLIPTPDNNTLILDKDLGYGPYDAETASGGQALTGQIKYNQYNEYSISALLNEVRVGDGIPLMLYTDVIDGEKEESATFYTDNYTTDVQKQPSIFWQYLDLPPVLSNLTVSGAVNVDNIDLYNLSSTNLSSVVFNWTETNGDDIWYRLLHVSDGAINNKYHNAIMWLPLNEGNVDASTAPSYTVYNPNSESSGACTVGSAVRTRIDGQGGYAPILEGSTNGKITVPTATNTGLKDLNKFTLSLHYTPSTDDKGNTRYIVTQTDDMADADNNFYIFKNSSNKIVVRMGVATFLTGSSTITCDSSVPTSIIFQFHSGSTSDVKAKLYINGALEATSINNQLVTGSNDFVVGGRFQSGYNGTTGRVEEVVLWNTIVEIPPQNSYIYDTKDLEETDGTTLGANQSYNGRVFAADYHNFRGKGPQSIGTTNQVSWRPTTV